MARRNVSLVSADGRTIRTPRLVAEKKKKSRVGHISPVLADGYTPRAARRRARASVCVRQKKLTEIEQ
jgi:hypothetical protein